jgi:hypothetical protein
MMQLIGEVTDCYPCHIQSPINQQYKKPGFDKSELSALEKKSTQKHRCDKQLSNPFKRSTLRSISVLLTVSLYLEKIFFGETKCFYEALS